MRDETIGDFLAKLAARVPAPGGGAAAALEAAQAAALLAMVARYSDGPKYQDSAALISHVLAEADQLVTDSLALARADADAFGAVAAAYKMPKETADQRGARSAAIAQALAGAARPPADVIKAALRLSGLAEELLPAANKNVITDVAAAAEAARAAAATARVNIEVNLRGIKEHGLHEELTGIAALADEIAVAAERVVNAVREEITR